MGSRENGDIESGSHSSSDITNRSLKQFFASSAEEMWKDEEFLLVVKTYLESNKKAQEFYKSVEACVNKENETLLRLTYVIELNEREVEIESGKYNTEESKCLIMLEDLIELEAKGVDALEEEYLKVTRMVYEEKEGKEDMHVLEELKRVKEKFGSTCKDELLDISKAVHTEQAVLLDKLSNHKRQIEKQLTKIKKWRKASTVMFRIGFFIVPVLTALVMVVTVPSAIEVLVGAFSATIGSIGKWYIYTWRKREHAAEFHKDGIETIQKSSFLLIKDMEAMEVLVDKMFLGTQRVMQIVERIGRVKQEDKEAMDETGKMMTESLEIVEQARVRASKCNKDIITLNDLVSNRLIS